MKETYIKLEGATAKLGLGERRQNYQQKAQERVWNHSHRGIEFWSSERISKEQDEQKKVQRQVNNADRAYYGPQ